MIKLYVKEIEVTIEEETIESYLVLNEEEYKKEKNKKEFQKVETELSYETAFMYPEYLIIEDGILKLHNVKELKEYTYRLFLLENKTDVATNLLHPGYYPIEQVNNLISFRVEKEIDEIHLNILQNDYLVVKNKEIYLKPFAVNMFHIKERTNLWEEKENERLTNRKLY